MVFGSSVAGHATAAASVQESSSPEAELESSQATKANIAVKNRVL
jgi:hypothetical protein